MTRITSELKIVDESFRKEDTYAYSLSVILSRKKFAFCVLDHKKNKYILLESVPLPGDISSQQLCRHLSQYVEENKWLGRRFKDVRVIYVDKRSVLVPNPLFKEEHKKEYLAFCEQVDSDEEVRYNKLRNIQACNLYVIPRDLSLTIDEVFPDNTLFHNASVFIDVACLRYKHRGNDEGCLVNIDRDYFEIIVMKGKDLRLYNFFNYTTPEDFLYYLLFIMDQLQLNPETVPLTLAGVIDKGDALYNLLYKYVRHIDFADRNDTFNYSYVFDNIPSHYFFNLLNLNMCG